MKILKIIGCIVIFLGAVLLTTYCMGHVTLRQLQYETGFLQMQVMRLENKMNLILQQDKCDCIPFFEVTRLKRLEDKLDILLKRKTTTLSILSDEQGVEKK